MEIWRRWRGDGTRRGIGGIEGDVPAPRGPNVQAAEKSGAIGVLEPSRTEKLAELGRSVQAEANAGRFVLSLLGILLSMSLVGLLLFLLMR